MPLLLLGLGAAILLLILAWGLARTAGLSDEALGYKCPGWCDIAIPHRHATNGSVLLSQARRIPPRGWD